MTMVKETPRVIADPDNYDARAKLGDGRTGGFVKLSSDDISEIYRIAAKAEL